MSRPAASVLVQQLLAIVPWVTERGGATVGEIAERFELSEASVYRLLSQAMCYEVVGNFGHDNLGIVVFAPPDADDAALDHPASSADRADRSDRPDRARRASRDGWGEAWVHVEPGAMLDRPVDLTAVQAFGLLAAGESALMLPGADPDGALATGLAKLRDAYSERVHVSVELDAPAHLASVRAATAVGERIAISYYTPNADEVTRREVDPLHLRYRSGHWYLGGWCHLRRGLRSFRVDRIESCEPTGQRHDRAADVSASEPTVSAEFDSACEVVLSIPRSDLWKVEAYPSRSVRSDGDCCIVSYDIASPRTLGQMLLRLGADTRIVNAADLPPSMARAGISAAEEILANYRPFPTQ